MPPEGGVFGGSDEPASRRARIMGWAVAAAVAILLVILLLMGGARWHLDAF